MIHSKGITYILAANFFERFAFYGVKAILLLSLLDLTTGHTWPAAEALAFYATFAMSLYVGSLVGGVCIDLFLGAYRALFLGAVLMALGYLSLIFLQGEAIYLAGGLIVIGSGLFKPSIPTMLSHQLAPQPEKLDSIFTGQYLMVTLGSVLGPIMVGLLAESLGWSSGFICAAVIASIVVVLVLSGKQYLPKQSQQANIKDQTQNQPLLPAFAMVSVAALIAGVFFVFIGLGTELTFDALSEQKNNVANGQNFTLIITGILLAVLWWFVEINSWYKVAISFVILSLGWLVFNYSLPNSWHTRHLVVFSLVLFAIAEAFCSAIFLSIVAKNAYKPLLSSSFSWYFLLSSTVLLLVMPIISDKTNMILLALIAMFCGVAILLMALFTRTTPAINKEE